MTEERIPQRGDIWYFNPNPVAGHELKVKHYFIVVTVAEINQALGVALCCPISTKADSARSAGVTVAVRPMDTERGDLRGVVLCHQLRATDLKARNAQFETFAEETLIQEVIIKLTNIIDPQ